MRDFEKNSVVLAKNSFNEEALVKSLQICCLGLLGIFGVASILLILNFLLVLAS